MSTTPSTTQDLRLRVPQSPVDIFAGWKTLSNDSDRLPLDLEYGSVGQPLGPVVHSSYPFSSRVSVLEASMMDRTTVLLADAEAGDWKAAYDLNHQSICARVAALEDLLSVPPRVRFVVDTYYEKLRGMLEKLDQIDSQLADEIDIDTKLLRDLAIDDVSEQIMASYQLNVSTLKKRADLTALQLRIKSEMGEFQRARSYEELFNKNRDRYRAVLCVASRGVDAAKAKILLPDDVSEVSTDPYAKIPAANLEQYREELSIKLRSNLYALDLHIENLKNQISLIKSSISFGAVGFFFGRLFNTKGYQDRKNMIEGIEAAIQNYQAANRRLIAAAQKQMVNLAFSLAKKPSTTRQSFEKTQKFLKAFGAVSSVQLAPTQAATFVRKLHQEAAALSEEIDSDKRVWWRRLLNIKPTAKIAEFQQKMANIDLLTPSLSPFQALYARGIFTEENLTPIFGRDADFMAVLASLEPSRQQMQLIELIQDKSALEGTLPEHKAVCDWALRKLGVPMASARDADEESKTQEAEILAVPSLTRAHPVRLIFTESWTPAVFGDDLDENPKAIAARKRRNQGWAKPEDRDARVLAVFNQENQRQKTTMREPLAEFLAEAARQERLVDVTPPQGAGVGAGSSGAAAVRAQVLRPAIGWEDLRPTVLTKSMQDIGDVFDRFQPVVLNAALVCAYFLQRGVSFESLLAAAKASKPDQSPVFADFLARTQIYDLPIFLTQLAAESSQSPHSSDFSGTLGALCSKTPDEKRRILRDQRNFNLAQWEGFLTQSVRFLKQQIPGHSPREFQFALSYTAALRKRQALLSQGASSATSINLAEIATQKVSLLLSDAGKLLKDLMEKPLREKGDIDHLVSKIDALLVLLARVSPDAKGTLPNGLTLEEARLGWNGIRALVLGQENYLEGSETVAIDSEKINAVFRGDVSLKDRGVNATRNGGFEALRNRYYGYHLFMLLDDPRSVLTDEKRDDAKRLWAQVKAIKLPELQGRNCQEVVQQRAQASADYLKTFAINLHRRNAERLPAAIGAEVKATNLTLDTRVQKASEEAHAFFLALEKYLGVSQPVSDEVLKKYRNLRSWGLLLGLDDDLTKKFGDLSSTLFEGPVILELKKLKESYKTADGREIFNSGCCQEITQVIARGWRTNAPENRLLSTYSDRYEWIKARLVHEAEVHRRVVERESTLEKSIHAVALAGAGLFGFEGISLDRPGDATAANLNAFRLDQSVNPLVTFDLRNRHTQDLFKTVHQILGSSHPVVLEQYEKLIQQSLVLSGEGVNPRAIHAFVFEVTRDLLSADSRAHNADVAKVLNKVLGQYLIDGVVRRALPLSLGADATDPQFSIHGMSQDQLLREYIGYTLFDFGYTYGDPLNVEAVSLRMLGQMIQPNFLQDLISEIKPLAHLHSLTLEEMIALDKEGLSRKLTSARHLEDLLKILTGPTRHRFSEDTRSGFEASHGVTGIAFNQKFKALLENAATLPLNEADFTEAHQAQLNSVVLTIAMRMADPETLEKVTLAKVRCLFASDQDPENYGQVLKFIRSIEGEPALAAMPRYAPYSFMDENGQTSHLVRVPADYVWPQVAEKAWTPASDLLLVAFAPNEKVFEFRLHQIKSLLGEVSASHEDPNTLRAVQELIAYVGIHRRPEEQPGLVFAGRNQQRDQAALDKVLRDSLMTSGYSQSLEMLAVRYASPEVLDAIRWTRIQELTMRCLENPSEGNKSDYLNYFKELAQFLDPEASVSAEVAVLRRGALDRSLNKTPAGNLRLFLTPKYQAYFDKFSKLILGLDQLDLIEAHAKNPDGSFVSPFDFHPEHHAADRRVIRGALLDAGSLPDVILSAADKAKLEEPVSLDMALREILASHVSDKDAAVRFCHRQKEITALNPQNASVSSGELADYVNRDLVVLPIGANAGHVNSVETFHAKLLLAQAKVQSPERYAESWLAKSNVHELFSDATFNQRMTTRSPGEVDHQLMDLVVHGLKGFVDEEESRTFLSGLEAQSDTPAGARAQIANAHAVTGHSRGAAAGGSTVTHQFDMALFQSAAIELLKSQAGIEATAKAIEDLQLMATSLYVGRIAEKQLTDLSEALSELLSQVSIPGELVSYDASRRQWNLNEATIFSPEFGEAVRQFQHWIQKGLSPDFYSEDLAEIREVFEDAGLVDLFDQVSPALKALMVFEDERQKMIELFQTMPASPSPEALSEFLRAMQIRFKTRVQEEIGKIQALSQLESSTRAEQDTQILNLMGRFFNLAERVHFSIDHYSALEPFFERLKSGSLGRVLVASFAGLVEAIGNVWPFGGPITQSYKHVRDAATAFFSHLFGPGRGIPREIEEMISKLDRGFCAKPANAQEAFSRWINLFSRIFETTGLGVARDTASLLNDRPHNGRLKSLLDGMFSIPAIAAMNTLGSFLKSYKDLLSNPDFKREVSKSYEAVRDWLKIDRPVFDSRELPVFTHFQKLVIGLGGSRRQELLALIDENMHKRREERAYCDMLGSLKTYLSQSCEEFPAGDESPREHLGAYDFGCKFSGLSSVEFGRVFEENFKKSNARYYQVKLLGDFVYANFVSNKDSQGNRIIDPKVDNTRVIEEIFNRPGFGFINSLQALKIEGSCNLDSLIAHLRAATQQDVAFSNLVETVIIPYLKSERARVLSDAEIALLNALPRVLEYRDQVRWGIAHPNVLVILPCPVPGTPAEKNAWLMLYASAEVERTGLRGHVSRQDILSELISSSLGEFSEEQIRAAIESVRELTQIREAAMAAMNANPPQEDPFLRSTPEDLFKLFSVFFAVAETDGTVDALRMKINQGTDFFARKEIEGLVGQVLTHILKTSDVEALTRFKQFLETFATDEQLDQLKAFSLTLSLRHHRGLLSWAPEFLALNDSARAEAHSVHATFMKRLHGTRLSSVGSSQLRFSELPFPDVLGKTPVLYRRQMKDFIHHLRFVSAVAVKGKRAQRTQALENLLSWKRDLEAQVNFFKAEFLRKLREANALALPVVPGAPPRDELRSVREYIESQIFLLDAMKHLLSEEELARFYREISPGLSSGQIEQLFAPVALPGDTQAFDFYSSLGSMAMAMAKGEVVSFDSSFGSLNSSSASMVSDELEPVFYPEEKTLSDSRSLFNGVALHLYDMYLCLRQAGSFGSDEMATLPKSAFVNYGLLTQAGVAIDGPLMFFQEAKALFGKTEGIFARKEVFDSVGYQKWATNILLRDAIEKTLTSPLDEEIAAEKIALAKAYLEFKHGDESLYSAETRSLLGERTVREAFEAMRVASLHGISEEFLTGWSAASRRNYYSGLVQTSSQRGHSRILMVPAVAERLLARALEGFPVNVRVNEITATKRLKDSHYLVRADRGVLPLLTESARLELEARGIGQKRGDHFILNDLSKEEILRRLDRVSGYQILVDSLRDYKARHGVESVFNTELSVLLGAVGRRDLIPQLQTRGLLAEDDSVFSAVKIRFKPSNPTDLEESFAELIALLGPVNDRAQLQEAVERHYKSNVAECRLVLQKGGSYTYLRSEEACEAFARDLDPSASAGAGTHRGSSLFAPAASFSALGAAAGDSSSVRGVLSLKDRAGYGDDDASSYSGGASEHKGSESEEESQRGFD